MPVVRVKGPSFGEMAERARGLSRTEVAETLAEESLALISDGFVDGVAPDGTPWVELKIREGQPLRDKGGLMNSWARETADDSGFTLINGKEYADYHQQGTGIHGPRGMKIVPVTAKALKIPGVGFRASSDGTPARPMVPDGELPKRWADRYDEAITEYLDGVFSE